MSCKGDKAPELNGFSMNFIQEDFMTIFKNLLKEVPLYPASTQFFLSIPKIVWDLKHKGFQTRSLASYIYSSLQRCQLGGCIASREGWWGGVNMLSWGRQILDATLIWNKVVNSLLRRGGTRRIYKLDMEEAYDHVSWNFLFYILQWLVLVTKGAHTWVFALLPLLLHYFLFLRCFLQLWWRPLTYWLSEEEMINHSGVNA